MIIVPTIGRALSFRSLRFADKYRCSGSGANPVNTTRDPEKLGGDVWAGVKTPKKSSNAAPEVERTPEEMAATCANYQAEMNLTLRLRTTHPPTEAEASRQTDNSTTSPEASRTTHARQT